MAEAQAIGGDEMKRKCPEDADQHEGKPTCEKTVRGKIYDYAYYCTRTKGHRMGLHHAHSPDGYCYMTWFNKKRK